MWMESPCFAYVFVFAFFSAFVFVIVLPLVIACHCLSACMEISRSFKTRMWMESPCCAFVFLFAFFSAFVFVIVLPLVIACHSLSACHCLSSSQRLSLLVIVIALVIACHRLSACMEISVSLKTRMWMESPCCEEMRDFLMTRGASTDFYRHPPTSNVIHDKLPTYGFVPLREPLHCSRNCLKFEAGPLCEIES